MEASDRRGRRVAPGSILSSVKNAPRFGSSCQNQLSSSIPKMMRNNPRGAKSTSLNQNSSSLVAADDERPCGWPASDGKASGVAAVIGSTGGTASM